MHSDIDLLHHVLQLWEHSLLNIVHFRHYVFASLLIYSAALLSVPLRKIRECVAGEATNGRQQRR